MLSKSITGFRLASPPVNLASLSSRCYSNSNGHNNGSNRQHSRRWKTAFAFGAAGAIGAGYHNYGEQLIKAASLNTEEEEIVKELQAICPNVDVSASKTHAFVVGQRIGKGVALAVAKPDTLAQAVELLQACVSRDVAVITQGANTGLTGGSVPRDNIDRPVVVINMRKLNKITAVGSGEKTIMTCLAGSGILSLQKLAGGLNRESHSVLGSIFLNPSVAAGVAFGSGGTQIRKGPAYTERVLYAKVDANGKVHVINDTGIKAADTAELYRKLETGDISEADIDMKHKAKFWKDDYPVHVSKLDSSVSRYNSACDSPSEASRCEGKVMILATVHQTFAKANKKEVYWVSSDSFGSMSNLRTKVALADPTGKSLPASCEYMNKDTIDITISHGTTACAAILFGGMDNLGRMYRLQAMADKILPVGFSDRMLTICGSLIPRKVILPHGVLNQLHKNHHCLLDLSDFGGGELDALKTRFNNHLAENECVATLLSQDDVVKANIFRFTNAAAFKIYCLLKNRPGLSLDYALRKNDTSGFPEVPAPVHKRMIYGHFGCNVLHDDIIFENGVNPHTEKYNIKDIIEESGGILPAEHGHGTEYSGTAAFQKKLEKTDPLNIMNPGVAGTSPLRNYA